MLPASSATLPCETGRRAAFCVDEHDATGVTETQFYSPDTFPSQEMAVEAAIQAGREKIKVRFK